MEKKYSVPYCPVDKNKLLAQKAYTMFYLKFY